MDGPGGVVFIVGLEEGVFPHHMCLDTPTQLEEERRLCYVGFTRAKKQLIVTHAEQRRMNGRELFHRASRFLSEIPAHLLQEIRFRNRPQRASKPYGQGSNHPEGRRSHGASGSSHVIDQTGLKLGQTVTHPKFGSGTIINAEGSGESARIQVQFNQHGTKWLVLQYANLT